MTLIQKLSGKVVGESGGRNVTISRTYFGLLRDSYLGKPCEENHTVFLEPESFTIHFILLPFIPVSINTIMFRNPVFFVYI